MSGLHHHAHLNRALRDVEARLQHADVPPPDRHGDPADQLTARVDHEGAVLDRAKLVERQRLIRAALAKIDRGEYGTCEDCCRPIAAKRLAVAPEALRCLGCEHRHEVAQARTQRVRAVPEPEDEG